MKTERLQLRLDEDVLARVRALAERRGLSVSAMLRVLVLEAHRATFGEVPELSLPLTESVRSPTALALASTNAAPSSTGEVSLLDLHRELFDTEPTDNHVKLYSVRPVFHGLASAEIDDDLADALLCAALLYATTDRVGTIWIFAPERHARHMMERTERVISRQRALGTLDQWSARLRRIRSGKPQAWPPMLPENWLAYGLTKDDLPGWLRRRLAT